jgi:hypothetical protein
MRKKQQHGTARHRPEQRQRQSDNESLKHCSDIRRQSSKSVRIEAQALFRASMQWHSSARAVAEVSGQPAPPRRPAQRTAHGRLCRHRGARRGPDLDTLGAHVLDQPDAARRPPWQGLCHRCAGTCYAAQRRPDGRHGGLRGHAPAQHAARRCSRPCLPLAAASAPRASPGAGPQGRRRVAPQQPRHAPPPAAGSHASMSPALRQSGTTASRPGRAVTVAALQPQLQCERRG